jgi:hypothetical protein
MLSVAPIADARTHQTGVPTALFPNLREGFVTDLQRGADTKLSCERNTVAAGKRANRAYSAIYFE